MIFKPLATYASLLETIFSSSAADQISREPSFPSQSFGLMDSLLRLILDLSKSFRVLLQKVEIYFRLVSTIMISILNDFIFGVLGVQNGAKYRCIVHRNSSSAHPLLQWVVGGNQCKNRRLLVSEKKNKKKTRGTGRASQPELLPYTTKKLCQ